MLRLIGIFILTAVLLPLAWPVTAQAQQKGGDQVIMLEEITIKVEPELPTVTVTISRQNPVIQTGELRRPSDGLLLDQAGAAKPLQTEVPVSRIDDPRKVLAKPRTQ